MLLERHESNLEEHDVRLIELEKLSAEFYDLKLYRKSETDKQRVKLNDMEGRATALEAATAEIRANMQFDH
jgi:hypothetical protein